MSVAGPDTGSARAVARGPGRVKPLVLKVGGRALETPADARALAVELAFTPGARVLIHGGGAEVTTWCGRLGLPARFLDGRRVTDPATLEVVAAVLAGLANKRLVAALRDAGLDAVGLSALDGGLAEAALHPDAARLGEVGQVQAVRPGLIETLLAHGFLPVISSLAALGTRLLNVNADDLAASLAGALKARTLVLLSDTPGLLLDGAPVGRLSAAGLDAALAHPDVQGGMRPKLMAAREALAQGVERVHIAAWSGPGTLRALLSDHDRREGSLAPGTTILAAEPAEAAHG